MQDPISSKICWRKLIQIFCAWTLFCAPVLSAAKTVHQKIKDPTVQTPPLGKIPRVIAELSPQTKFAFVVDKALRTLSLWKNAQVPSLFAAYPTDMGRKPGNKLYRGDYKTPEGIYFFQETFTQPYLDFSLYGRRAFTMNYPNYFDLLQNKTGSGIWLHAIPDTQSLNRGSKGCVVVRNNVIEKLKKYIQLKNTPIVVQDKVDYIPPKEWSQQNHSLNQWLAEWKKAWESKNLEEYISYYSEDFKSLGMNKTKWKKYKDELNSKYKFIRVELENTDILKHNDQYIFRFQQKYQSDENQDFGEKYLYVKSVDGKLKILSEQWRALPSAKSTSEKTPTVLASGRKKDDPS
tara:strand:+ start:2545 stop:3588 length:1044 start_codon:yes stop_codon:yes gene_type:complete